MIIQPIEPQVDRPITTAIFLPETQRFLKFHQTKQNLEIHGDIQLCSYIQLKKNLLNADKTNKIAQNSNKHVELKIAQNSNTRQHSTEHQRKPLSSPTKREKKKKKTS